MKIQRDCYLRICLKFTFGDTDKWLEFVYNFEIANFGEYSFVRFFLKLQINIFAKFSDNF